MQKQLKPAEHISMLKRVHQIAKTHGEQAVMIDLLKAGIASSTADKMVRGDYLATRFRRKTAERLQKFLKRYDVVLNK